MSWHLVPMPQFLRNGEGEGGGYAFALRAASRSLKAVSSATAFRATLSITNSIVSLSIRKLYSVVSYACIAQIELISSIAKTPFKTLSDRSGPRIPTSCETAPKCLSTILGTTTSPVTSSACSSIRLNVIRYKENSAIIAEITDIFLCSMARAFARRSSQLLINWAMMTPAKPITPTIAVWKSFKTSYVIQSNMVGGFA